MRFVVFLGTRIVAAVVCVAMKMVHLIPASVATAAMIAAVVSSEPAVTRTRMGIETSGNADLRTFDNVETNSTVVASDENATVVDINRKNLAEKISRLKRGRDFLQSLHGYTVNFDKQEEVHGTLLDEQSMFIKCRQKPFSIYLRWDQGDTGREVIFVAGADDGKMIAHDGGWKAKIPAFQLSPDSWLAMRDARYPVTNAGLSSLIDVMLEIHEEDLSTANYEICKIESGCESDARPSLKFTTIYRSPAASPVYRKSVTHLDCDLNLPLHTEHFGWPASGKASDPSGCDDSTLIERYTFRNLALDAALTDADFDRANESYNFH